MTYLKVFCFLVCALKKEIKKEEEEKEEKKYICVCVLSA